MYNIHNKSILGVVIIGLLLFAGIIIMNSKTKPIKKTSQYSEFLTGLITKNCERSQKAFDEIKKIDPGMQDPLKYKVDINSPEIIVSYDQMNQYIIMCRNNQIDKKELINIAQAINKDLNNVNKYLNVKE
ncbi:MAG: hypothetical protein AB1782_15465 [Cyanobacteriota bacterium]